MTPKQKRIVAALAILNIAVILPLVAVIARSTSHVATPSNFYRPTLSRSPSPTLQACQWQAAQLLAHAGLGGTVILAPENTLHFQITYPLRMGQTTDDAAQAVWTAFDVALALQEQEQACATFTQVQITILAHNDQVKTQINASASTTDLAAFNTGELSEDEFIERVTFDVIREP
jgi:hypothetical protein